VQSGSKPSGRLGVVGAHCEWDLTLICTIPTVIAVDGGPLPSSSARVNSTSGAPAQHPFFEVFLPALFDVDLVLRRTIEARIVDFSLTW
jgi:hypothetical protein